MSQALNTWESEFWFWHLSMSLQFILGSISIVLGWDPCMCVYFNPLWRLIEFSWRTLHQVTSPNTAVTTTPHLGSRKIFCISTWDLTYHNHRSLQLRLYPPPSSASCASKTREFSCLHLRWISDKGWLMAASNRIWRSDPGPRGRSSSFNLPLAEDEPAGENQSHKL